VKSHESSDVLLRLLVPRYLEYRIVLLDLEQVLVMTAQIFLDGLAHGFFKLNMVEILILDECHHAKKNHAYARIMMVSCCLSHA
jgi:ERCC4-related helicase